MVDILENFPSILPRDDDSTFVRYIGAHEDELGEFENNITEIKLSRQVENSSGDDLERIGRLFGRVGRRQGRSDEQYKQYLKAVVQAFSGRGTKHSMSVGLATALGIDEENVDIRADQTEVEYDVILYDWSAHDVDTVYNIAEILDPSGVDQNSVTYTEDDTQVVSDLIDVQTPVVTGDTSESTDDTSIEIGYNPHSDMDITAETTEHATVDAVSSARWDNVAWDESLWDDQNDTEETVTEDEVEVTVTDV